MVVAIIAINVTGGTNIDVDPFSPSSSTSIFSVVEEPGQRWASSSVRVSHSVNEPLVQSHSIAPSVKQVGLNAKP